MNFGGRKKLIGDTTNDITSKNFDKKKFVSIPQIYYTSSPNRSNATHVYTYQKLHIWGYLHFE